MTRPTVLLSCLAGALLALPALPAVSAQAEPSVRAGSEFCADLPGLVSNRWEGAGVDDPADPDTGEDADWDNDANWSSGHSPFSTDGDDDYVCIPTGGTPVIDPNPPQENDDVFLAALDVADGATLKEDEGAKLFIGGDQATQRSVVRDGGSLVLEAGTFGGAGRLDLRGTMYWRSLGVGKGATLATRKCTLFESCDGPVTGPTGLIDVKPTGHLEVDGAGVNLQDQYGLVVHGVVRLSGDGYVAADRGTTLDLRPGGRLEIDNDGGYYEGKTLFGVTSPSVIHNAGTIVKRAGDQTSVIQADYSQDQGAVRVDSGTLALPKGSGVPAEVKPGRRYGSGACFTPAPGCSTSTFGDHDGIAKSLSSTTFAVPTGAAGRVGVLVEERNGRAGPDDLTRPVLAHAGTGLGATKGDPAILTFRFDERLLDGRGWRDVEIFRQARKGEPFERLKDCRTSGAPPRGSVACVDRRGIEDVSSRNVVDAEGPGSDPDVVMVVRTTGTSRWVAR